MRFKSFRIGKAKEITDMDTAKVDAVITNHIADLEEQVNTRTRELGKIKQQLKDFASTKQVAKGEEVAPPRPHGPLGELSVEREGENEEKEADTSAVLEEVTEEEATEEVQVIKVKAEDTATLEVKKEAPKEVKTEAPKDGGDDSLTNLFSQEEENINPLASLINALPDVTSQELLDDVQEIKEIIKERQQR